MSNFKVEIRENVGKDSNSGFPRIVQCKDSKRILLLQGKGLHGFRGIFLAGEGLTFGEYYARWAGDFVDFKGEIVIKCE